MHASLSSPLFKFNLENDLNFAWFLKIEAKDRPL